MFSKSITEWCFSFGCGLKPPVTWIQSLGGLSVIVLYSVCPSTLNQASNEVTDMLHKCDTMRCSSTKHLQYLEDP